MSSKKEILASLAAITAAVESMPDDVEFSHAGGGCGSLDRKITLTSHLGFDWRGGIKRPFNQTIHREKLLAGGVTVQSFEHLEIGDEEIK
jgi:hypothetical protein